ncbi:hypothetical protein AOQ84DRAFT_22673 [Glonium stellatum]|uniref:Heterokaryon incompatibility domain-containing protein n=1 Tax=Glonium stellatum TaxID=574774 RepID=A0A8E2F2U1_9PEZI|nr:hypothetical protein AOQ84DRAFT_22673 [Glonium stellatum]
MSRIFACAKYIFAWIGEFDTLGKSGFEAIMSAGQDLQIDSEFEEKDDWNPGRARLEKRRLHALTAFFSRLWFRRAWVVQEVVYARRLYLWSGPFFLDWWLIVPILRTIQEKGLEDKMANLTSSLVCRQPTMKFGKKLASIETKNKSQESLTLPVTYVEILGNVKAAIAFANGVIEMKKRLGMPCYYPDHANKRKTPDNKIGDFSPKREASDSTKTTEVLKSVSNREDYQSTTCSRRTMQDQLESRPGHLSEPFAEQKAREHVNSNFGRDHGARINLSFVNHEFSVTEPTASTPTSLFSLITEFRDVGASDPRDKVFAFLNLASQTPDLKANYRMTVQSVFIRTTKNMLSTNGLTIFSHVQDPSDTKVHDLPSWVPRPQRPPRKVFIRGQGRVISIFS